MTDANPNEILVVFPGGTVPMRAGTLAEKMTSSAAAQDWKEHNQGYSDEPWTLGRWGDLLWRHSPSSRQGIHKAVVFAFNPEVGLHSMPETVSTFELGHLVYYCEVLKPLLAAWPDSREDLARELVFIRVAATYAGPGRERVREALKEYVLDYLDDPEDLANIGEVSPETLRLIAPDG
ncbi:hypothetical protein [Longispora urticae]